MRKRTAVVAVAVAGLALAAGCGGGSGDTPRGAPAETSGAPGAADGGGRATPAAFTFEAPALDGGRVVGADYADTGVALWFWAPW